MDEKQPLLGSPETTCSTNEPKAKSNSGSYKNYGFNSDINAADKKISDAENPGIKFSGGEETKESRVHRSLPDATNTSGGFQKHFLASRCFRILRSTLLSILTATTIAGAIITLPLYMAGFSDPMVNSDGYVAVFLVMFWWPIGILVLLLLQKLFIDRSTTIWPKVPWWYVVVPGVCYGFGNVSSILTALPSRTPPYLIAILQPITIPSTVVIRYILTSKGINVKQGLCVMTLVVGLFIATEPSIWSFQGESGQIGAWYYPVLYAFNPISTGLYTVFSEMAVTDKQCGVLSFMFANMTVMYGVIVLCFWVDFLPGIGMATSPENFLEHLINGVNCFYNIGGASVCNQATTPAILSIIFSISGSSLGVVIVKYAESSIFMSLIIGMATVISTFFWYFFSAQPHFHWQPRFDVSTIFVIVGMACMVPSIICYAYYGEGIKKKRNVTVEEEKTCIKQTLTE